jgi:NAD(P)-dependent dehydrogenase (short-subunit alcohol dehydrogenase family)
LEEQGTQMVDNGKTVVISGANSGIGFEAASVFTGAGARVMMGCRNAERAHEAVKRIRAKNLKAVVESIELDLARPVVPSNGD